MFRAGFQDPSIATGTSPTGPPGRSLTNSSIQSVDGLPQEEKLKDVSLRVRGTSKMDVRGRRKHPDPDCGPDAKRAKLSEFSGCAALGLTPSPEQQEEIAGWIAAAPQTVVHAFGDGLGGTCRRLALQSPDRLKAVLQRFAARRADGDPDGETLSWMEAFVVSMLAHNLGVHISKPKPAAPLASTAGPALAPIPLVGSRRQILRISAGRAAAAAGIHPYTDVGELFLELLYQDLPELLLHDAALAGVEVISNADERERLLEKSGAAMVLEAILKDATRAESVADARGAREAVEKTVASARQSGRLSEQESADLLNALQLEVNLDFGTRHEDAALDLYEARLGSKTYGQQHRIKVAMPYSGPAAALARFPLAGTGCRTAIEAMAAAAEEKRKVAEEKRKSQENDGLASSSATDADPETYFFLTGFTDAIVDVTGQAVVPSGTSSATRSVTETLVVEVKHRMGKIQNPPNIYDVVQLSTYCHVLGCARGDLVQCLRRSKSSETELHVTRMDFSPGSPDRRGFDEHVLPALYNITAAVYATRTDPARRQQLLQAIDPAARKELVYASCPHLAR